MSVILIGNISETKISDLSTLCSINAKESEEINNNINNYIINPINLDIKELFRSFSAKSSFFGKKLLEPINKPNKSTKIVNKKIFKKNVKNNNNLKLNEYKKIKKYSEKNNNLEIKKTATNINNASKNVNVNTFIKKNHISKHNSKINTNEIYTQDKEIVKTMKEYPPNKPGLYAHDYNLAKENDIDKKSESFGTMNRDTVPIIFYNHLMIGRKGDIKNVNNKKRYLKTSITQRNKKKLLTIIYCSPY